MKCMRTVLQMPHIVMDPPGTWKSPTGGEEEDYSPLAPLCSGVQCQARLEFLHGSWKLMDLHLWLFAGVLNEMHSMKTLVWHLSQSDSGEASASLVLSLYP